MSARFRHNMLRTRLIIILIVIGALWLPAFIVSIAVFEPYVFVPQDATVIESTVKKSWRGKDRWKPYVKYEYVRDGRTMSSDVLCRERFDFRGQVEAEAFTKAYPVGSSARVFVAPWSPGRAVLLRSGGPYLTTFLIGVICVGGVIGIRTYRRLRRSGWRKLPQSPEF
ncbi:MAG TPA: DUF3592 domain-containing protein [Phycisphaerales bacterium]|nr:DUF3592 domain-containing protein [Phycisphaerales bacterium]